MDKLATALRERQDELHLSLRGLARELEVAPGTAEGWVKGWRAPEYRHLPRVADFIERTVEEVVRWVIDDSQATGDYLSSLDLAFAGV